MIDLQKTSSEVSEEKTKIKAVLEFVEGFIIQSDDDFTFAGRVIRDAKATFKRIDERRREITSPLLQAKQSVDALFRPALDSLTGVEALLKKKIGEYTAAKERERAAVMLDSANTYATGGVPTAIIPARPEAQGVSVRNVWEYEIIDADQVPRNFCSPDHDKIKMSRDWSAYNEHHPPPPIPGIRFYQTQAVRVRS